MADCCSSYKVALGVTIPLMLLLMTVLIGVIIGLVIWKRIKVAKFLYNLQLPKFTEIPQWLMGRWRRPSSPPPEVYVERTVKNPTYDIEEGTPSAGTAKANEARETNELYEEVPTENGMDYMDEGCDVYDIPEFPSSNQLEPYATTDIFGGGEMLDPYAVTDISQTEGQLGAYAFTDVPVGDLSNEKRKLVSAEVHDDNKPNASSTKTSSMGKQMTPQKNVPSATKGNVTAAVMAPVIIASKQLAPQSKTTGKKEKVQKKAPVAPRTKQTNSQQKETADSHTVIGGNATSAKPAAPPRSLSGSGAKDKVSSGAACAIGESSADPYKVKNIRVKFEDQDRRRSKSYTGVAWEEVLQEEPVSKLRSTTRSSVRDKPKPMPKKKGILTKKIRERGASDSGVEEYSKLDLKSQYASLEPHRGNETKSEEARGAKMSQDSYSHFKR